MTHRLFALASLGLTPLVVLALLALPRDAISTSVVAQGTGSITGQVIWCSPLPIRIGAAGAEVPQEAIAQAEAGQAVEGQPALAQPDGGVRPPGQPVPIPIPRPVPPRPIPAGAVLVAVQNTSLSARTDEGGNFRIDGVPSGQYYTVAAGPIRNAPNATALRPNVLVGSAGETTNVGQLSLGGPCGFPLPLAVPGGATEVQPAEAP